MPLLASLRSGAVFDQSETYRYWLWREWNVELPRLSFVMLNPSTADADRNDPTIRRCIQFAQSWGYGAVDVVNLFAYRTTQPQMLCRVKAPIGQENDRHLQTVCAQTDAIVLAWGNWGSLHGRDRAVLKLLEGQRAFCLGMTRSNQPRHPLYVRGNTLMQSF
ncbi:DUF1643 domain-containing protein [Microcoleus sp. FACHB-1515]|uniref:DUF1643 domain-containing protein n=1 Tax=Cyanophyceae TaxID=3028117 RepID=UPI001688DB81|nr:DUF1643 domain-containing protein [Microcoleus sp. FACHB-1515]MBD2089629.1 DUF1643 domain-containing protein [Microcoleus sp. FACHB-1515]